MQSKLLEHLNVHSILSNEQYGFRTKLKTDNAAYQLIDGILNALNNKLLIGGIFCDLGKAFDYVRIEQNSIWVRALPGPVHLGLKTGPLCPIFHTKLEEPCSFSKVPDGP